MNSLKFSRRAKIVCTLGPSTNTHEKIAALAKAGMDVARLNFSHGIHSEHENKIKIIRQVSKELNKPIAILQDLQGPKIRVQSFSQGSVYLKSGDDFILTTRDVTGDEKRVSVSYKSFNQDVKIGDIVLLNDGLIRLKVKKIIGKDVHFRVIYGGKLSNHKGINLPGQAVSVKAFTQKDKDDLEFGLAKEVDYIALSFVQQPQDIKEVKSLIAKQKMNIPVVAKIEKPQAVETIDEIVEIADAIMIARGDLGVEVNPEEVPAIQKQIISLCNQKGVPVITATQMLDSMIHNPRPTRAEASDVANAILDGTDAVMLSGETAAGQYPVESVKMMHRIICLIEKEYLGKMHVTKRKPGVTYSTAQALGWCAGQAADLINAASIVCLTQSGSTAKMIARFRPDEPIIAISPSESTVRRMSLYWGIRGYIFKKFKDNFDDAVEDVKNFLKEKKFVTAGDTIILTAGLPFYLHDITNMIRIEEIK